MWGMSLPVWSLYPIVHLLATYYRVGKEWVSHEHGGHVISVPHSVQPFSALPGWSLQWAYKQNCLLVILLRCEDE